MPKRVGGGFELAHLPILENCHDQQNAVGARQARLGDLDLIQHKIFADNRFGGGFARRAQVVQTALEKIGFGQNRQAIGARALVDLGLARGIEIGRDQTFGGRGFLDLGDQPQTVGVAQ